MRIVMLHTQKRNPPFLRQLPGYQGRVIPRMKICRDDLRPHFQKRLCLFDRVLKRLHRPQVRQISVSRAQKVGGYHMMKAQNPVYLIDFGGKG